MIRDTNKKVENRNIQDNTTINKTCYELLHSEANGFYIEKMFWTPNGFAFGHEVLHKNITEEWARDFLDILARNSEGANLTVDKETNRIIVY